KVEEGKIRYCFSLTLDVACIVLFPDNFVLWGSSAEHGAVLEYEELLKKAQGEATRKNEVDKVTQGNDWWEGKASGPLLNYGEAVGLMRQRTPGTVNYRNSWEGGLWALSVRGVCCGVVGWGISQDGVNEFVTGKG
ncbi:hypothetical protein FRX31_029855, partial [Thalictrum thalictroides]